MLGMETLHQQQAASSNKGRAPRTSPLGAFGPKVVVPLEKKDKGEKDSEKDKDAVRGSRYDSQFYKTKLCMFWQSGRCTRKFCKYAHGDEELKRAPDLRKTAMCRVMLSKGSCPNEDCNFAHSLDELRATDKFYKTTMCCFYRYGACKLGDKCRHAHSKTELRPPPDGEAPPAMHALDQSAIPGIPFQHAELGQRGGQVPAFGRPPGQGSDAMGAPPKDVEEDSDDDLDLGPIPTWNRLHTMPASLEQVLPPFQQAPVWRGAPAPLPPATPPPVPSFSANFAPNPVPAAAPIKQVEDDFDLDSDDDLGPVPDWARLHTMPASLDQGSLPSSSCQMAPAMPRGAVQDDTATVQRFRAMDLVRGRAGAGTGIGTSLGPATMAFIPGNVMQLPVVGGMVIMPVAIGQLQTMSKEQQAELLKAAQPEFYED